MSQFSLAEIFRMAEEIERNGHAFYRQAIETAQDARSKDIFSNLA